jgi:hypothetical protein
VTKKLSQGDADIALAMAKNTLIWLGDYPHQQVSTDVGNVVRQSQMIVDQAAELESLRDVKPGVLVVPAEAVDRVVLIADPEQLKGLPPYSVVLDADLDVFQLQHDTRDLLRWYSAGREHAYDPDYMTYPLTLIHRGDPS